MKKIKTEPGYFKGFSTEVVLIIEDCPKCDKKVHYPLYQKSTCPSCKNKLPGSKLREKTKERVRYHLKAEK